MSAVTAYAGLGSNLDNPREHVLRALEELDRIPGTRVARRSALYRTAPLAQTPQPEFINAVAELETILGPHRLLAELQMIEARHHRERPFRDAPRTLDLDLLLYGQETIASPELTVPHPRMHERAFVLEPLAEIEPATYIPGRGRVDKLLRACAGQRVERCP